MSIVQLIFPTVQYLRSPSHIQLKVKQQHELCSAFSVKPLMKDTIDLSFKEEWVVLVPFEKTMGDPEKFYYSSQSEEVNQKLNALHYYSMRWKQP